MGSESKQESLQGVSRNRNLKSVFPVPLNPSTNDKFDCPTVVDLQDAITRDKSERKLNVTKKVGLTQTKNGKLASMTTKGYFNCVS